VSEDAGTGSAPVSPCTSVCVLDPSTGWCRGCFRTIQEIAGWLDFTAEEKRRVVRAIAERQAMRGGIA
jgi:predicted Fe-S protein YdhL (DUF1289 family)